MRAFTAFFILLVALLFTSQVLAGPVLEVSILGIYRPTLRLIYESRLVRTPAALLLRHPRLLALRRTMLLQIHRVVSLPVLEPAHLVLARVLQARTAILAPAVGSQDMVSVFRHTVWLVLIHYSCFWKRVERVGLWYCSLRAVSAMYGEDRSEMKRQ